VKLLIGRSRAGQAARDPEPDLKVRSVTYDAQPAIAIRPPESREISRRSACPRLRFQAPPLSESSRSSARSSVIACAGRRRVASAPRRMSSEHLSGQIVERFVAAIPGRFAARAGHGRREKRSEKTAFFRVLRGGVKGNRHSRPVPQERPAWPGKGADATWWNPIWMGL